MHEKPWQLWMCHLDIQENLYIFSPWAPWPRNFTSIRGLFSIINVLYINNNKQRDRACGGIQKAQRRVCLCFIVLSSVICECVSKAEKWEELNDTTPAQLSGCLLVLRRHDDGSLRRGWRADPAAAGRRRDGLDLSMTFHNLSWPLHDLSNLTWHFHDLSWPYHDLSMTFLWPFITFPWPCMTFHDLSMTFHNLSMTFHDQLWPLMTFHNLPWPLHDLS